MNPREIELIEFGPEHFDQLIEWSPTPEFLLQWAGPSMHFPLGRIDKTAGHAWLMRILVGDPTLRESRVRGLRSRPAEA